MSAADFCAANDLPVYITFAAICTHLGINYGAASARAVLAAYVKKQGKGLPTPTPEPTPPPRNFKAANVPTPAPSKNNDLAAILADNIKEYLNFNDAPINEAKIIELIKQHATGQITTQYINQALNSTIEIKTKHKQFDELLSLISAGQNVWINGGAGGGKTHAAGDVAKVLNLDFYSKSLSAQTSEFSLLGFINAAGNFVETDFFKAYVNGGIFVLDEIDNSNPNILSVLNSALANGHCSFANGIQKRHENFILIATANTTGRGANQKYVGRLVADAATLDRFVMLNWEYDLKLEALLSSDIIAAKVNDLRNKAINAGLNCVISPRASVSIAKLTWAGVSLDNALNYTIFNKLTDNERAILCK